MNEYPLSKLIVTKSYSKENYKAKQPHVELNKKLIARGQKGYVLNDRIPFVFVAGRVNLKEPSSMWSEDPIYAIENNLQPDALHYIEYLRKPIGRIFRAIDEGLVDEIFSGAHMRQVKIETPKAQKGNIMQFLVKIHVCLTCRQPLKTGESNPCINCVKDAMLQENDALEKSYMELVGKHQKHSQDFEASKETCYKCQGDRGVIVCEARDCEVYFERKQNEMLTEKAKEKMESFTALKRRNDGDPMEEVDEW